MGVDGNVAAIISGGVRVIYCNQLSHEEVWLLTRYAKNERATIPAHELRQVLLGRTIRLHHYVTAITI